MLCVGRPQRQIVDVFASPQKHNSKLGSVTETLALRVKDFLEVKGYKSFFDVDNLKRITMDSLASAIKRSMAVVLFLVGPSQTSVINSLLILYLYTGR